MIIKSFFKSIFDFILKSLPAQLILSMILAFFLGEILSQNIVSFFYTVSSILKDILMHFLPFLIISYLATSLLKFKKNALYTVIGVFIAVFISNFLAVSISVLYGKLVLPSVSMSSHNTIAGSGDIVPYFSLPKAFIQTKYAPLALITGVLSGLLLAIFDRLFFLRTLFFKMQKISSIFLEKFFIPLVPIYVFGFMLKLKYSGEVGFIVKNYGVVFLLGVMLVVFYELFLYLIASKFNLKKFISYIREMIPAMLTAFSTTSSAATLPFTLKAVRANIKSDYSDFVTPVTSNVHMMADTLFLPLLSLSFLLVMGKEIPSFVSLIPFITMFAITKFSATGVPGGGMFVVLPVIEKYLGLSSEMTALIATIYIMQDFFTTTFNVFGNGAFAIITFNMFKKRFNTEK